MPLLCESVPVRTGDASDIPCSSAHDLPQFLRGNLGYGDMDLLFILAQEEPALLAHLSAHLGVNAPVPEAAVTGGHETGPLPPTGTTLGSTPKPTTVWCPRAAAHHEQGN